MLNVAVCLYIKRHEDTRYKAIYLNERNVNDLINRIYEKITPPSAKSIKSKDTSSSTVINRNSNTVLPPTPMSTIPNLNTMPQLEQANTGHPLHHVELVRVTKDKRLEVEMEDDSVRELSDGTDMLVEWDGNNKLILIF